MSLTLNLNGICRYYAFAGTFIMAFIGGYTVFLPGNWDIPTFFFSYTMVGITPVLFLSWKIVHKTTVSMLHVMSTPIIADILNQWRRAQDVTFFEKERIEVDQYEDNYMG